MPWPWKAGGKSSAVSWPRPNAGWTRATSRPRSPKCSACSHWLPATSACLYAGLLSERADDADARAGLDAVVAALARQAQRLAADFDFDAAEASLEQARRWAPDHPALAAAERRLRQSREAQAEAASAGASADPERLASLLLEARAALHRGDLIEPPGASAWDRLQVAAALAPQAPEVQRALEEYERAAERARSARWRADIR